MMFNYKLNKTVDNENLNLNQANELLVQFSSGDITHKMLENDKSLEKLQKKQTLNRGLTKYGRSNFVNGALLNSRVNY